MVEWQPYPNLPVYLVCPIDGEGHSHTLHRNYLLPFSSNLKQKEWTNSVGGEGPSDGPALISHMSDALPVDWLTGSHLESALNLLSEQDEPVISEMTGLTSTDPTDRGLQDASDEPILLRQSSISARNQLLSRYQNFALQQNNNFSGVSDICAGLWVCIQIISIVYIILCGNTV